MSKLALVIANTHYTDPGLAQLTAPGKDAEEFARVLQSPGICAFDSVNVLLNKPAFVVNEAIEEFYAQKRADDLLVLYFSGHGVRDEVGALYLAVENTNRFRLRSTAINSDFIRESMNQSRSKRQILVLDCCNSGAFAQGTKAVTGGSMGIASAFEGTGYGHVVLTASDATQFAWEGDRVIGSTENSLFTHFLVKGLDGDADQDGNGCITVDDLYEYAYEQIVRITPKQTPSKWSYKEQGEIILRQSTRLEDIKPASLPDDLVTEIESLYPEVRLRAVQRLGKLLDGRNLGLARSAREALERLATEDDSRRVVQAATAILESVRQAEQLAQQKAEEERVAREKAEAEQKANEERLAREKAEQETLEKAIRAEAERLVTERITKERADREAQRLAAEKAIREKAEQEALEKSVREQAEIEAQRLIAEKAAKEKLEKEKAAHEKAEREAQRLAAEGIAGETTKSGFSELLQYVQALFNRLGFAKLKNHVYLILGSIIVIALLGVGLYFLTAPANNIFFFSGVDAAGVSIYKYDGKNIAKYYSQPDGTAKNWSFTTGFDGKFYFVSKRDGKAEIYRSNGTVTAAERVTYTKSSAQSWSPATSLNGYLYFVSNRDGKAEIYRSNGSVTGERVTYTDGFAESWSPTSSLNGYLYFVSNRDGKAEIYRSNDSVTGERVTYTEGNAQSWSPASSPDGYVYFVSNRDGKAEIYRSNGTVAGERVTYTEGNAQSWGPIVVGQNIYFTSNRNDDTNKIYRLVAPVVAISDMESWTIQNPLEGTRP